MLQRLKNKYWWTLSSPQFNLIFTLWTLIVYNHLFWKKYAELVPGGNFGFWGIVCLILLLNAGCTILMFKYTSKFLAVLMVMINACAFYFMDTYKIAIDKIMLLNLLETDINEARETFSYSLLWYVLSVGVVPSVFIVKTQIVYADFCRELLRRFLIVLISLLVVAGVVFGGYKTTAQFMRNNRPIKYLLVPINYYGAVISLAKIKLKEHKGPVLKIAEDARLDRYWKDKSKKNLVVWVAGETARKANWGLSGYEVDNTSALNQYGENLLNFTQVTSCGTSTSISLPCMFDSRDRRHFDLWDAGKSENILDVAAKSGYKVWWRDNNSGCKGICARVETEDSCVGKANCYDEVLVNGLSRRIAAEDKDMLVVLHQKGSHGPTYYLRYPEEKERYKPSCKTERLDKCSRDEIVNVYDNTISYTAENLAAVIEEMKNLAKDYNLVLIYASDHGESLGENGIYLHAAPYIIAPKGQVEIPMVVWMNNQTAENLGIDLKCMQKMQDNELSHDNLFHTVLGLLGIRTKVYDPQLDFIAACRMKN